MATQGLTTEPDTGGETVVLTENTEHPSAVLRDLGEVVFKLRAFMESSGGEYALGVETGMQRAAEMIENVIKRHDQGE